MKKIIFLLAALLGFSSLYAQGPDKREQIESFRIAYFTKQIGLSADEAKKFWPVYDAMQEEVHKLQKERRMRHRSIRQNVESISDSELEKMINEDFVSRQKELDIEKKYHEQFKSILNVKKLALFYRAQESFKRELLKKIQEERKAK